MVTYGHLSSVGGAGISSSLPRSFSANNVGIQSPMNQNLAVNGAAIRSMYPSQMISTFHPWSGMTNPNTININPATPNMSGSRYFDVLRSNSFSGRPIAMVIVPLPPTCSKKAQFLTCRLCWLQNTFSCQYITICYVKYSILLFQKQDFSPGFSVIKLTLFILWNISQHKALS